MADGILAGEKESAAPKGSGTLEPWGTPMFEGDGEGRRPARRELGVGMQDQITSTVKTGTGQLP